MSQTTELYEETNPTAESTRVTPQLLTVNDLDYNMDTYTKDLRDNFEGWLKSVKISKEEKAWQRRHFPTFIKKLKNGTITLNDDGTWHDSSLEMYNTENEKDDYWGHLLSFANEGLDAQPTYNRYASKGLPEYSLNSGIDILGNDIDSFVSMDGWIDPDKKTKRSIEKRSKYLLEKLKAISANPLDYGSFANKNEMLRWKNKVDSAILAINNNGGIVTPEVYYYLSEIGISDVADKFKTDFEVSTPSTPVAAPSTGSGTGSGTIVNPDYGNSFSTDIFDTWLNANSKWKYTRSNFNGISTKGPIHPDTKKLIDGVIDNISDLKGLINGIYDYLYHGKRRMLFDIIGTSSYRDKRLGENSAFVVLNLFMKNSNLLIREILNELKNNNSQYIEKGSNNVYYLPSYGKSNKMLRYDVVNERIDEVSPYNSSKFRKAVIDEFKKSTGLSPDSSNTDWYSGYLKSGGILKAKNGLSWTDVVTNNIQYDDSDYLKWDSVSNKYITANEGDEGAIKKSDLMSSLNYDNFLKLLKLNLGNNKYAGFNYTTGTWDFQDKVPTDLNILYNLSSSYTNNLKNSDTSKVYTRLLNNKDLYSRINSLMSDGEPFLYDANNPDAFNDWIKSTLAKDSEYKGIYYVPDATGGKFYRTKSNNPMYGKLFTAADVTGVDPDKNDGKGIDYNNLLEASSYIVPAAGDISAALYTTNQNNKSEEKLLKAIQPNLKERSLEVYNPLRVDFSQMVNGYTAANNLEKRASELANTLTDTSLATAAQRQGTLDKTALVLAINLNVDLNLQTQILNRIASQNATNKEANQIAFDNRTENNRVTLAKAESEIANNKQNTEIWNKLMAKYSNLFGEALTTKWKDNKQKLETSKQLLANKSMNLALKSGKEEFKAKYLVDHIGASESDVNAAWIESDKYQEIIEQYQKDLGLITDTQTSNKWPYNKRNGGVLSLKTQSILNKIIK